MEVTCPVCTLHHANASREHLLDLVVELMSWPEVQVPVEDSRDQFNYDRWAILLCKSVDFDENVIEQTQLFFDSSVGHQHTCDIELCQRELLRDVSSCIF